MNSRECSGVLIVCIGNGGTDQRANNDLNVLYGSPLFDDELADRAPECPFVVNGHTYRKGYYLADEVMLVGDGANFSKFDLRSDLLFGIRLIMANLHLFGLIDGQIWPPDWLSRFPSMAQLHVPLLLDDMDDVILWRDRDGVLRSLMQKLKTQDRLRQWDVGPRINLNLLRCPLCDLVPDSHDHLFFECSFSSQVWYQVRALCGIDSISHRLADVIAFIVPISKGKTVISILSRIVVAATSYYIWLERNGRLFKKKTSSLDQIVQVILSMVRLKLVTFKFKKMSTRSRLLLDQWKIPSYCISHDRSSR
ncbi:reverse transcriptase domain, reverse transcriptase zinc-binding domain protein [Tanacetum coccineum]